MKSRAANTEAAILEAFDRAARRYRCIILDSGEQMPCDVRMTLYRDDVRWAAVLEELIFFSGSPGHDGIVDCLYKIGNCVQVSHASTQTDYDQIRATSDAPGESCFLPPLSLEVNPHVRAICVRNKRISLDLSNAALIRRNIAPPAAFTIHKRIPSGEIVEENVPPSLRGQHIVWSLLPEHRDILLATEEEKRRRLPFDLPKFMQLEEWHHPRLIMNRTKPSESEIFRLLAAAIASGDTSQYRPTLPPNTNWRNWTEYYRV